MKGTRVKYAPPRTSSTNPVFNLEVKTPTDINNTPCQQKENDPDTWFPSGEKLEEDIVKIEIAKSLCFECHEIDRCLSYALDNRIKYGIWGGATEQERERILRRRRR